MSEFVVKYPSHVDEKRIWHMRVFFLDQAHQAAKEISMETKGVVKVTTAETGCVLAKYENGRKIA